MAEQWNFVTSSFVDDQQALTTQSRLRQLRRTGSIQSLPAQSLLRKRDSTAITFSLSTKRPVVGRGCMPSKIVRGRNVSYAGTGIARPVQLDVVRNEEPQPEDGNEGGDGGDAGDGNDGADDAGEDGRGDGGATAGLQPDDDDNAWYSAEEEEEWDIDDESLWSNNRAMLRPILQSLAVWGKT